MITDLATAVTTVSPEELDRLFAGTPDSQLVETKDTVRVDTSKENKNVIPTQSAFDVPFVDLDNLDEKKEEIKDEKKEEVKDEKKEIQEGKDEKVEKKEVKEEKTTPEEAGQVTELLKNSVEYLIEKGIFKDFEGREETEMTEEFFAELLEKQAEAKAEERYLERKSQSGEFGEIMLEYLEKGGEPDKMIDIFKEKKAVEDFDIKDDDSKKELVTKWYKEVHGWKSDRIKRLVDGLIAEDGALDNEAEEIKNKYQENYKKQIQVLNQEQEQYHQEQIKRQKAFESNITKAITENKEYDDKRKKLVKDSIFRFKTLEDGTKVNDFYVKLAEIQSKPEAYIELAEFIMDKEGYLKRKAVDVENKVVDKTFKFLKGNGSLDKTTKGKHVESQKEDKSDYQGTNFSVVLK